MSSGKLRDENFELTKRKKIVKFLISKHFPIMYKSRDFLDYIKTVIFGLLNCSLEVPMNQNRNPLSITGLYSPQKINKILFFWNYLFTNIYGVCINSASIIYTELFKSINLDTLKAWTLHWYRKHTRTVRRVMIRSSQKSLYHR